MTKMAKANLFAGMGYVVKGQHACQDVCVLACVCVCVTVCVRESKREREHVCMLAWPAQG